MWFAFRQRVISWFGGGRVALNSHLEDFRTSEPVLTDTQMMERVGNANVQIGQNNTGNVRVVHLKQERHVTIHKYAAPETSKLTTEQLNAYRATQQRGDNAMLSKDQFRPGFEWVFRELKFPEQHREVLFDAVYSTLNEGLDRRLKAIRAVWPSEASWPSGHEFLQEQLREELEEEEEWVKGDPLPEVSNRELFKLLLVRFTQVSQRIFRNAQMRDLFADQRMRKRRPFIIMNREPMEEHAWCGRNSKVMLNLEEGLELMEQLTCNHPACRCTFDPCKGTV